jgi:SAM-dependent methyltransferase
LWTITLPALLEKRGDARPATRPSPAKDPALALHIIKHTLSKLLKLTRKAMPEFKRAQSNWSRYKGTLSHYTPEESAQKHAWVTKVLEDFRPERVLDIGANTGEFSALAADRGARVVSLERDAASAERLFRMSRKRRLNVQTIHADLARPSPAIGWENRESSTLIARLERQSELVLMLAVIHHLLLMEQIPLRAILELVHRLTWRYLILEWVPVTDPMFQSLMRGRDELYGSLTEDDLHTAAKGLFHTLRRQPLGNGRILILFAKD